MKTRTAKILGTRHVSGPRRRGLGDVVAGLIERHVLTPAESVAPAVVRAARRCGGCTQTKHALGTTEPHPDPGAVV